MQFQEGAQRSGSECVQQYAFGRSICPASAKSRSIRQTAFFFANAAGTAKISALEQTTKMGGFLKTDSNLAGTQERRTRFQSF